MYDAYLHSGVALCWEVVGGQKQGASLSAAGATQEEKKVATISSRQ